MVMEMSKTYQYRKVMKPLLERKRRARINKCLDRLKDMQVERLQQDGEHVTRLEKADILELTVEHMRKLKQQDAVSTNPQFNLQFESFRSGYVHAADQISQVLLQQRQPDEIGKKIIKFLSTRLMELQQQMSANNATTHHPGMHPVNISTNLCQIKIKTTINSTNNTTTLQSESSAYSFDDSDCSSETSSHKGESNEQLIDVTTVNEHAVSVLRLDESSQESMWRPW